MLRPAFYLLPFHIVLALGSGSGIIAAEVNSLTAPKNTIPVAISGGLLIDGNGGDPIANSCVIIRGNRIEAVGRHGVVVIPDNATVIDASGKSILPGLFDSHFHSKDNLKTPIEFELQNGVTSFRDPGHPFRFYDQLLASGKTIPRVFLCGGHLDADPIVWPGQAVVIQDDEDAERAVNSHVDRGASAIKVYFRLPLRHIRVACQTASRRGVPVTAHLELVDADDAINAGVIGIEHVTSFGTALADDDQAKRFKDLVSADSSARKEGRYRLWERIDMQDNDRLEEMLELVVRKGVFVSPTLAIFEARAGQKDATPSKVLGFQNMMRFIGICHEAGARLVVGSHTSAPFAARGKAYLREVELLVRAGISPLEVITAATKTGAEFFGVADRIGTIEPGKLADLVLIDGDPTQRISDIDKVSRVMLNGNWVPMTPDGLSIDSAGR